MHIVIVVYDYRLTCGQMSKYKTFMGPFGKVFLGAVLTYQIIYWSWLKLEMDEEKLEKNGNTYLSVSSVHELGLTLYRRSSWVGEKGS